MGGDVFGGDRKAPHPTGQLGGEGVVLGGGIATVGRVAVFPVEGRFQADVQGEIVDRAAHLGIGLYPATIEGGIARTKGPLGWIEHLHDRPILSNQAVVAHLVLIAGMGCSEGVNGRSDPVDRLVQDDQLGGGVNRVAVGIKAEPFAVIGRVNSHLYRRGLHLAHQLLQLLALAWIRDRAAGAQGGLPAWLGRGPWGTPASRLRGDAGLAHLLQQFKQAGIAAALPLLGSHVTGQPAQAA